MKRYSDCSQHKACIFQMSETQTVQTLTQDEKDHQEMIAGAEVGRAFLEMAMQHPQDIDPEKLKRGVAKLLIPSRFKDLSAEDLRKMLIARYVENLSITMARDLDVTSHQVAIPENHAHIASDLAEYWQKKDFRTLCQQEITDDGKGNSVSRITHITVEW